MKLKSNNKIIKHTGKSLVLVSLDKMNTLLGSEYQNHVLEKNIGMYTLLPQE